MKAIRILSLKKFSQENTHSSITNNMIGHTNIDHQGIFN